MEQKWQKTGEWESQHLIKKKELENDLAEAERQDRLQRAKIENYNLSEVEGDLELLYEKVKSDMDCIKTDAIHSRERLELAYGEKKREFEVFTNKFNLTRFPKPVYLGMSVSLLALATVLETSALASFFYAGGHVASKFEAVAMGGAGAFINLGLGFFGGYFCSRYARYGRGLNKSRDPELFKSAQKTRRLAVFGTVFTAAGLTYAHAQIAMTRVLGETQFLLHDHVHDLPRAFESLDSIAGIVFSAGISIFAWRKSIDGFSHWHPQLTSLYNEGIKKAIEALKLMNKRLDADAAKAACWGQKLAEIEAKLEAEKQAFDPLLQRVLSSRVHNRDLLKHYNDEYEAFLRDEKETVARYEPGISIHPETIDPIKSDVLSEKLNFAEKADAIERDYRQKKKQIADTAHKLRGLYGETSKLIIKECAAFKAKFTTKKKGQ